MKNNNNNVIIIVMVISNIIKVWCNMVYNMCIK